MTEIKGNNYMYYDIIHLVHKNVPLCRHTPGVNTSLYPAAMYEVVAP